MRPVRRRPPRLLAALRRACCAAAAACALGAAAALLLGAALSARGAAPCARATPWASAEAQEEALRVALVTLSDARGGAGGERFARSRTHEHKLSFLRAERVPCARAALRAAMWEGRWRCWPGLDA